MSDLELSNLVLWRDETLLVVNIPSGLPALPDGYNPTAPYLGGILKPAFGRLWVVHRLDRHTSGVVAFARTSQARRTLNTQFEQRQVSKVYHALVVGNPDWTEKTLRSPRARRWVVL
jgi:23S rRNA-/tRNA-specific pseudouridylate synthase